MAWRCERMLVVLLPLCLDACTAPYCEVYSCAEAGEGASGTTQGETETTQGETETTQGETETETETETDATETEAETDATETDATGETSDTASAVCEGYEVGVEISLSGPDAPPCEGQYDVSGRVESVDGGTVTIDPCGCNEPDCEMSLLVLEVQQPSVQALPMLGTGSCVRFHLTTDGDGDACRIVRLDIALLNNSLLLYSTGAMVWSSTYAGLGIALGDEHDACEDDCSVWALRDLEVNSPDSSLSVPYGGNGAMTIGSSDYAVGAWPSGTRQVVDPLCELDAPLSLVSWTVRFVP